MLSDTPSVREDGRVAVTKLRNVRVEESLWRLVTIVAKRRQTTISQIMKNALVEYVEEHATEEDRAKAAAESSPVSGSN